MTINIIHLYTLNTNNKINALDIYTYFIFNVYVKNYSFKFATIYIYNTNYHNMITNK